MERGLAPELATEVAVQLMDYDALSAHARDELGITDTVAANPIQAAVTSALTFSVGAALPLIVVCTVGFMGAQKENAGNMASASLVMRSNFEGPASIIGILANHFEHRGSGTLVGVSSVAGERGRASNYVYGAAKAGYTAFLSGLRNRLSRHNINVVTVLPGFVDTKMTAGMQLPKLLTAQPAHVADAIFVAVTQGKNTIYIKSIWRLIMAVIRILPEGLFKKMTL